MLKRLNFLYVLFVPLTLLVVLLMASVDFAPKTCSPMGIVGLDQKNGRVYVLVAGGQTYIYGATMETWLPQSPSTPLNFNESSVVIKDGDTLIISVQRKEGSQTDLVITTPKGEVTAPICNSQN